MALTTLPTAALANDAVDNTKLNLANNYAFTGTVTSTAFSGGGSALSPINLTELDNSTGVLTLNKTFYNFTEWNDVWQTWQQNKTIWDNITDNTGTGLTSSYLQSIMNLTYYANTSQLASNFSLYAIHADVTQNIT